MSLSGRSGQAWQTSLADLSMILFMVTAAAVHDQPPPLALTPQAQAEASRGGEPLAIYQPAPGAPPLNVWLEQQAPDPRQRMTIVARYGAAPGARADAMAQAAQLLDEAGKLGRDARVVVEPGPGGTRVMLAFDRPADIASDNAAATGGTPTSAKAAGAGAGGVPGG